MRTDILRASACVGVLCLAAVVASGQVYINEFCSDPFGPVVGLDTNGDGVFATSGAQANDEFVEIVNAGPMTIDIGGWTLSDAFSLRHTFVAGALLPVGGAIIVFGGGSVGLFNMAGTGTGVLASTGALGLNNDNDTITLRNAMAAVVNAYSYTSMSADDGDGESVTRTPEMPGQPFMRHTTVTMGVFHSAGRRNDGTTPYAGTTSSPVAYPGNATDAAVAVGVNGFPDVTATNIHVINAGAFVTFSFTSPMSSLLFAPIIGAFQLYNTPTPTPPTSLPGDVAPAVWLSPTIGEIMFDGFSCIGFLFCPTLLPGGYVTGGQIPLILTGAGKSIMIQGFVFDAGHNLVNLGAMDAHELRIN